MTSTPEPSYEKRLALAHYTLESLQTRLRWEARGKWIVLSAAAVVGVIVLILTSQSHPDGNFPTFLVALGAALVTALLTVIAYPRLPVPSLRCPYCAGRAPVIAPPKAFPPPPTRT